MMGQVWWDYRFTDQSLLDNWDWDDGGKQMTGVRLRWHLEKKGGERWEGPATGFYAREPEQNVSNLVVATNMAALEKEGDSKYSGFLSGLRVNKSAWIAEGQLWYRNLCKTGQMISPLDPTSHNEYDLSVLLGKMMLPSPFPDNNNLTGLTASGNHTDEEIVRGFALLSSIFYCSSEAVELFKFYNDTIILESPATVLQATMNNLRPGTLTDHLNIQALHRLYQVLEKRFSLQQGAIVAGLSNFQTIKLSNFQGALVAGLATTQELSTLIARADPVVQSYSGILSQCIQGNCTSAQQLVKTLPSKSISKLL